MIETATTPIATPPTGLDQLFDAQRAAARCHPYPSADERREALAAVERLLRENVEAFVAAINADFGHRSAHETKSLEIYPSLAAAKHARGHVARWMRSVRRPVSIYFQLGRARIVKQPLGVVGIIVPWNYPLYLAVGPLVSALAAGNRVMLKTSEFAPKTGDLFALLVAKAFPPEQVAVVTGDASVAQAFSAKPFDHLLFTGSTSVGRQVMAAAAPNLTPLTLELGGKSPAIIASGYSIATAARRIMWGKCLNAGQTCIAPDYVLLPAASIPEFIAAARAEVARLYPAGAASPDYTAIINDRHYRRLQDLLDDASAQGAAIEPLADGQSDAVRKLPPHIVTHVDDAMRLMQDEIFGPLLPLVPYRDLDDALAYVAARPRPLSMYYFDDDRARTRRVLNRSHAGGVTVNDVLLHAVQEELPFGGVGASGMGCYHGEYGFNAFSHPKGVFTQSRFNGLNLFKPPFGRRVEAILSWLLRE